MKVSGGCHCGAVRFELDVAQPQVEIIDCNCSICAKVGYLHLTVPKSDFTLLKGRERLVGYRFGTLKAEHLFCARCGIKSFYQPRSHPDAYSVNLRCLDEGHGLKAHFVAFDGRQWDHAIDNLASAALDVRAESAAGEPKTPG